MRLFRSYVILFEEDKKLAALLDPRWGVDVIIGGHTHTYLEEPCVVAGIPIVQEGAPIDDKRIFRIGLQGYHYKNMQDFFGISEEEICRNGPSKVLSTNAIDILEEAL